MFKGKKIKVVLVDDYFQVDRDDFVGVRIVLEDNSEIRFGIANYPQCCEDFGFIEASEFDDYDKFIGAKVLEVACIRDPKAHFKEIVDLEKDKGFMCLDTEFINIKTTKGVMNFAVYNYHNGYYGHDVVAFYTQKDGFRKSLND